MKFLITGGEGFIGSKLCVELIKNDHEVTIINKKIDVSNIENTNNYYKDIDVVIHLASVSNIQDSISNPLSSVINNINMTVAALENAKRNGVKKFIFASTSSIYGNSPTPHREYMKPDILNP
jgi:UDP-N-acetylglucosamine 4-epimerase